MTDSPSAGATPVAAGATPAQTPPPATPPPPATGDDEGLGEAGKRAIERMKAERDEAVKANKALTGQFEELQNATRTDTEKAIAQAKKDGAAEALTRVQAQVRRSEVRAALSAAGMSGAMLNLASKADEFADLKVTDEGEVQGLEQAVAEFKKAIPDLFKPATVNGGKQPDFGGGPRGAPATTDSSMNDYIRAATGRR